MDGFLYVAGGEDQNDARNQAKHAVSNFCRYLIFCWELKWFDIVGKLP
jgi:hypothetical protein